VIKVIWGREWDELLARDVDGVLVEKMNNDARRRVPEVLGRRRRLHPRALLRARPAPSPLVEHLIRRRPRPTARGGHDYRKVYAAYKAATEYTGAPTVDPRQDDQGLDARSGRRGSQRHAPAEEAVRG
jgi:pyruvate dehydrogenase E1 component